ncbi:hypothetical protein H5202_19760 [Shewanella sp. SG41-4]|uniref:hypothetical protein n=1 Tax=Shewanella sp. SG41-4 TaxID=2760976 RepID=UPI00160452B5|nr:hypothetical protein [Shewanella sp. SG41-4]MBB1440855.1 hypothetical protein [Shewanella sp. SG41-4]
MIWRIIHQINADLPRVEKKNCIDLATSVSSIHGVDEYSKAALEQQVKVTRYLKR